MPLEQQVCAFLITLGAGCMAGFFFDIYKTLIRFFRLRKLALGIGDIIFWILLTGIVFILLLLGNNGEVRGFMFLGLALGAGIYIRVFGEHSPRVIMRGLVLIQKTFSFSVWFMGRIWILITAPFKFIYFLFTWPFKTMAKILAKFLDVFTGLLTRVIPVPVKNNYKRFLSLLVVIKSRMWKKK